MIQFPQSSSTGKRLKSIKVLVAFALKVIWYVLVTTPFDNYVDIPQYVLQQQLSNKSNIVYLEHLECKKRKIHIMCVHILVSLFRQATLHCFCAMAWITVKSNGTYIS